MVVLMFLLFWFFSHFEQYGDITDLYMPKVFSLTLSLSCRYIGTHVRMYIFNIHEYMHKYKIVFFYAIIALVGINMI